MQETEFEVVLTRWDVLKAHCLASYSRPLFLVIRASVLVMTLFATGGSLKWKVGGGFFLLLVGQYLFFEACWMSTLVIFGLLKTAGSKRSGLLGRHVYRLTAEGLKETASENEWMHRWAQVERPVSFAGYVFVRIAGQASNRVLPVRDLGSRAMEFVTAVNQKRSTTP